MNFIKNSLFRFMFHKMQLITTVHSRVLLTVLKMKLEMMMMEVVAMFQR